MSAALALILMQAVSMPSRPVEPWTGDVQVLVCTVVDENRVSTEYVLTLTDTDAFIVGQTPGQAIQMEAFAPVENLPTVLRGEAKMRRLQFAAGNHTAFVRQYYPENELRRTIITVGLSAGEAQGMRFETYAGFCSPTQAMTPEVTQ